MVQFCNSSLGCPARYYCDPGSGICEPCDHVCLPVPRHDCQVNCPDFFDASDPSAPATAPVILDLATPESAEDGGIFVYAVIVTALFLLILIVIPLLALTVYCRMRRRPGTALGLHVPPISASVARSISHLARDDSRHSQLPAEQIPLRELAISDRRSSSRIEESAVDLHQPPRRSRSREVSPRQAQTDHDESQQPLLQLVAHAMQQHDQRRSYPRSETMPRSSQEGGRFLKRSISQDKSSQTKPETRTTGSSPINVGYASHETTKYPRTDNTVSESSRRTKKPEASADMRMTPITTPHQESNVDITDIAKSTDGIGPLRLDDAPATERFPNIPVRGHHRSRRHPLEHRLDLDTFSMEMQPEDKDPLARDAERRRRRRAEQSGEGGGGDAEADRKKALGVINVRPPKEKADPSLTQVKTLSKPSNVLEKTRSSAAPAPSIEDPPPGNNPPVLAPPQQQTSVPSVLARTPRQSGQGSIREPVLRGGSAAKPPQSTKNESDEARKSVQSIPKSNDKGAASRLKDLTPGGAHTVQQIPSPSELKTSVTPSPNVPRTPSQAQPRPRSSQDRAEGDPHATDPDDPPDSIMYQPEDMSGADTSTLAIYDQDLPLPGRNSLSPSSPWPQKTEASISRDVPSFNQNIISSTPKQQSQTPNRQTVPSYPQVQDRDLPSHHEAHAQTNSSQTTVQTKPKPHRSPSDLQSPTTPSQTSSQTGTQISPSDPLNTTQSQQPSESNPQIPSNDPINTTRSQQPNQTPPQTPIALLSRQGDTTPHQQSPTAHLPSQTEADRDNTSRHPEPPGFVNHTATQQADIPVEPPPQSRGDATRSEGAAERVSPPGGAAAESPSQSGAADSRADSGAAEALQLSLQEEDTPRFTLSDAREGSDPDEERRLSMATGLSDSLLDDDQQPTSRLCELVKGPRWVQGFSYFEGEFNMEIYVENHIDAHWALLELTQITGEPPRRFKIIHNKDRQ